MGTCVAVEVREREPLSSFRPDHRPPDGVGKPCGMSHLHERGQACPHGGSAAPTLSTEDALCAPLPTSPATTGAPETCCICASSRRPNTGGPPAACATPPAGP